MTDTTTYTPGQIALRLNIGEDRVRRVVRKECADHVPDELRMVPGGRVDDKVLFVFAGIFDCVASGRAVTRTAPSPTSLVRSIERRSA